jgi:hypothetical protein
MVPSAHESEGAAYIADIATLIPTQVDAAELAQTFFASERVGDEINGFALQLADSFGIERRPCVLDLARFPSWR